MGSVHNLSYFSRTLSALSLFVLLAFISQTANAQVSVKTSRGIAKAQAGELLVKYGSGLATSLAGIRNQTATVNARAASVNRGIGARVLKTLGGIGWQRVKIPATMTLEEGIAYYQKQPGVLAVEPNFLGTVKVEPNDPSFNINQMYGMYKIGAPTAWNKSKGSANVVVGVIDSGVNYTHEDLAANMWRNPGESGNGKETNGVDDDGNGYVDDVYGIDPFDGDTDPMDVHSHGSHVSGTIGAVGNNGTGVAGVNWNVKIIAIKIGTSTGQVSFAASAEGWQYLVALKQRGVNIRVANASIGGPSFSQAQKDAIDLAGNAGILSVCAAGNEMTNNDATPSYPANHTSASILSVGASDQEDKMADFSNWGATTVDLAAPGVDIFSTYWPGNNNYANSSGTSMASPMAAGAAALLCAYNPGLTPASLKKLMMDTVDPISFWEGKTVTGGRLNLARAVQAVDPAGRPTVVNVTPTGLLTTIRPTIVITFNQPMNTASVTSAWSMTPAVPGSFAWSNSNKTLTFTPTGNLGAGTSYLGRIAATAASAAGMTLDGNVNQASQGSPADDYTWTFRVTGAPPNDNFANAATIAGDTGTMPGHNNNASRETNEPNHGGTFNQGDKSVWYKWTAPATGNARFHTTGSSFSNVLAVYTGTSVGALTSIASDTIAVNNTCILAFRAQAATTYYIAIDGALNWATETTPSYTSTGNILLNWKLDRSPANDFFAGAQVITGTAGNTTGDTRGAYNEPNDGYHPGYYSSIWYKWTAPSTGAVTFDTEGTGFDTVLAGFTGGPAITNATLFTRDEDGGTGSLSKMPFTCIAGTTYYISVGNSGYPFDEPRGDVKLRWSFVPAPSNDMFAGSIAMTPQAGGTLNGSNVGATMENGEPNPTYSRGGQSIWYHWVAPANGVVTINTANSAFNTVLSAYTGGTVNNLLLVSENDDDASVTNLKTSKIKFTAVAGTTYRVRIDNGEYIDTQASVGYPQAHGATKCAWTFTAAPSNDKFASAAIITGTGGRVTGSNVGANVEPGEPTPTYSRGGKSIWYKWTAPSNGAATFDTAGGTYLNGTPFNTSLAVYTGTQVNALTQIAENDDDMTNAPTTSSRVRFTSVAGTVYYVRIDNGSYQSGDSSQLYDSGHGSTVLTWNLVGAPANDSFSTPFVLNLANAGRAVSSTVGANVEVNEPTPTYSRGGQSIWYQWTAPSAGQFTIHTMGSKNSLGLDYNTHLAVYTGGLVGSLTEVTSNDDDGALVTSRVSFQAQGGTIYRIRVDNGAYGSGDSVQFYDAIHGTVVLNWSLNGAPVSAPIIQSFSPASGAPGATVTVNGTGFTGTSTVTFDGVAATFNTVTATSLKAVVPANARTGRITITTPNGTGMSTADFLVPPAVTSFTPTSGVPGANITIAGARFTSVSKVTFAGLATTFQVNSPTQIVAKVPVDASTGRIAVTTNGGVGTSTTDFVVPPAIVSFTPASGPAGTVVTISGRNFTGTSAVKFGTATATFTVLSATSVRATVPAGATTARLTLTTPAGTATSAATFTVTQPVGAPTVTSFTPASGVVGTQVTITGTNLSTATAVKFNGTAATITSKTATQIVTKVPAGATTGAISVTSAAGTGASAANFTVTQPAPTVTSFTPTSGLVGTSVTITGTNLSTTTAVKFNGTAATITSKTATQIVTKVPTGATTGRINVTTPGGSVNSATNFTVTAAAPTITGFTPSVGKAGTLVTITGTNFTGATQIRFNTTAAANPTITATSIRVAVPTGATTGKITVVTPGGTVVSAATFTIDTTVPTLTLTNPVQASYIKALPGTLTGAVNDNAGISNVKSVLFTLKGTINGMVQYWNTATRVWGAAAVFNATTPARPNTSTTWTSTGALPSGATNLPSGAYTIEVTATDVPGNSFKLTRTFTVDTVLPDLTITSPANSVTLTQLPASLAGTVNDNNGISRVASVVWAIRRTVSGANQFWNAATQAWQAADVNNATTPTRPGTATTWNSTGALPSGTTNLPDGSYIVRATANDLAGNSRIVQNTVVISRTQPSTYAISGKVTLNGTGLSGVTITRSGSATTVTTNASGDYSLSGLTGNTTYTATPSRSGYKFTPVNLSVAVATANVTGKNFTAALLAPTITSFSPTSGPVGTQVTITGTNLSGATALKFNTTTATITSNTATQIVATVPAGATTGKVSVTTPGGTITSTGNFTVTVPATDTTPPTVTITTPAANGSYASLAAASGTASDAGGSGLEGVYAALYRLDAGKTGWTHIYDWASGSWITDSAVTTTIVKTSGTTNWSLGLPQVGAGNYELWITALDNANPPNQATWINRQFTTTNVSNNNFASPRVITGTQGQVTGSNIGANKETGEPNHANATGGASVWYSWTPANSGTVSFSTAGSTTLTGAELDTLLAIYTGTSVSALTVRASNDDEITSQITTSLATFNAVAGTNYRIAIDGYSGAQGDLVLSWTQTVGVTSSAPASAIAAVPGSTVRLSRSSASEASQDIQLVFTAGLKAEVANQPNQYEVTVNGEPAEVTEVVPNGNIVRLTLEEGSVAVGDIVRVQWKLQDTNGRNCSGSTQLTVK